MSWDEVVLAIFMSSPTLQTLLVALTLILMILAALFRRGDAR